MDGARFVYLPVMVRCPRNNSLLRDVLVNAAAALLVYFVFFRSDGDAVRRG